MKTLAICMLIMLVPALTIGQQHGNESQKIKQDLLEKSKRQKNTAYILLGVGAVSAVSGALIFDNNFTLLGKGDDDAAGAGAILFVAGGLSMIASIPVFVASSKNRTKAAELTASIRVESIRNIYPKQIVTRYPAISLQWRIK